MCARCAAAGTANTSAATSVRNGVRMNPPRNCDGRRYPELGRGVHTFPRVSQTLRDGHHPSRTATCRRIFRPLLRNGESAMSSVRRVSSVVLLAALCAAVPGMLRGQEKTRFANLQDALQAGRAPFGGSRPSNANWIDGGGRDFLFMRAGSGGGGRGFVPPARAPPPAVRGPPAHI